MNRREFIVLLGGAAAWPLAGHAQQPEPVRRVGVLIALPENNPIVQAYVTAFVQALGRFEWAPARNLRIDYRFAAGDPTLFKTYAAELVGLSPDAILTGSSVAVGALQRQTRTIPIVFVNVSDPVGQGFVGSFARPGGNITGFTDAEAPLHATPSVARVAVIFNPDTLPPAPLFNRAIEAAAASFGMTVTLAPVHDDAGIEEVITAQAREPGGGLIVLPSPFMATHGDALVTAAVRHRLPLITGGAVTRAGGLMSYWPDPVDAYARAASYIDRILKGASPADLPVQQPTKYKLIINLKTAKAIGLTVPSAMLDLADEVIE